MKMPLFVLWYLVGCTTHPTQNDTTTPDVFRKDTLLFEEQEVLIHSIRHPEHTGETHKESDLKKPVLSASTCSLTVPEPYKQDRRAKKGTLIVVYKSLFRLGLYQNGSIQKIDGKNACFPIAMGHKPWGPKFKRDFESTPEGWYNIADKRDIGHSMFYRSLQVSYPNREDIKRALDHQVISQTVYHRLLKQINSGSSATQGTAMGGWIMIHGLGSESPFWTAGCIATANEVMDLLFPFVHVNDPILIIPWELNVKANGILIPLDPTPEDPFAPEARDFSYVRFTDF